MRNKNKLSQKKLRKRKRINAYIAEIKLGGCSICGYNKCSDALTFHHVEDKSKEVNQLKTWKVMEEIKKCILVCANCHAEIHARDGYGQPLLYEKPKQQMEIEFMC